MAHGEVTLLLRQLPEGGEDIRTQVVELLYKELRKIAAARMRRERPAHTLTPTSLVHEAYMRLGPDPLHGYTTKVHFLAAAAQAMRRVLVDHARGRNARKRLHEMDAFDPHLLALEAPTPEMANNALLVSDALEKLASHNERRAKVVELRFFGGMSEEETAEYLGVARRTVSRDWEFSKAWLHRYLSECGPMK